MNKFQRDEDQQLLFPFCPRLYSGLDTVLPSDGTFSEARRTKSRVAGVGDWGEKASKRSVDDFSPLPEPPAAPCRSTEGAADGDSRENKGV